MGTPGDIGFSEFGWALCQLVASLVRKQQPNCQPGEEKVIPSAKSGKQTNKKGGGWKNKDYLRRRLCLCQRITPEWLQPSYCEVCRCNCAFSSSSFESWFLFIGGGRQKLEIERVQLCNKQNGAERGASAAGTVGRAAFAASRPAA